MYTVAEKLGNNSRESHGFKTMHTFRTTSGSSVYILACSSQVRTIVVYITGQLKEKNCTFDICCCSTTALIIKSKYRLAQSQDNISDQSDMSRYGLLCQFPLEAFCEFAFELFCPFTLELFCQFTQMSPSETLIISYNRDGVSFQYIHTSNDAINANYILNKSSVTHQ